MFLKTNIPSNINKIETLIDIASLHYMTYKDLYFGLVFDPILKKNYFSYDL